MRAERRTPNVVLSVRRGAVLLEVVVSLTILATAGAAAAALAVQNLRAVEHMRESERRLRKASSFLEAVALWPREDLDKRLGERAQGAWRLLIEHRSPTIYTVSLADSSQRTRPLLVTSIYRPQRAPFASAASDSVGAEHHREGPDDSP